MLFSTPRGGRYPRVPPSMETVSICGCGAAGRILPTGRVLLMML
jgi:hypothetical protein